MVKWIGCNDRIDIGYFKTMKYLLTKFFILLYTIPDWRFKVWVRQWETWKLLDKSVDQIPRLTVAWCIPLTLLRSISNSKNFRFEVWKRQWKTRKPYCIHDNLLLPKLPYINEMSNWFSGILAPFCSLTLNAYS